MLCGAKTCRQDGFGSMLKAAARRARGDRRGRATHRENQDAWQALEDLVLNRSSVAELRLSSKGPTLPAGRVASLVIIARPRAQIENCSRREAPFGPADTSSNSDFVDDPGCVHTAVELCLS